MKAIKLDGLRRQVEPNKMKRPTSTSLLKRLRKRDLWPENPRPFVWIGADDVTAARDCLETVKANVSTALDTEFPTKGQRKDEVVIWSLSGASGQRFVLDSRWLQPGSMFAKWIADPRTKLVYFSFAADADVIEKNAEVDCEKSFYADVQIEGWFRDSTRKREALKEEGALYLDWWRYGYARLFGYYPK